MQCRAFNGGHQIHHVLSSDVVFARSVSISSLPSRQACCLRQLSKCRSSFYGGSFFRNKPLEPEELVPQRCSQCDGTGKCTCADCQGRGRLSRAGYNKKNRVDMTRLQGSKWTAIKETLGWRHFSVVQMRKGGSGLAFVLMQASCDPATQLWVNVSNLKDRGLWAAGWLQKSEMEDPQTALYTGVTCRACRGSGSTPCPVCDAMGAVLLPPSQLGAVSSAAAGAAEAVATPIGGRPRAAWGAGREWRGESRLRVMLSGEAAVGEAAVAGAAEGTAGTGASVGSGGDGGGAAGGGATVAGDEGEVLSEVRSPS